MVVTGMPQKPLKVLTIKEWIEDQFDKYMVVSFQSARLVLSIGWEKVTDDKDSGLVDNERMLNIGIPEDNLYMQVTQKSIIHTKSEMSNRIEVRV